MATLNCPKCEAKFSTGDGWAKAAVSTLIAAPAVPDMATQVRCPECGHLFADGDVRYLQSKWSKSLSIGLSILGVAIVAWIIYLVLLR